MDIAYIAHTETCTYLLDGEGICRSVLAASGGPCGGAAQQQGRPVRIPSSAERCIGAQYVATLDLREAGALVSLPKPGAQLLFARTEPSGRITLVRTGKVTRFEQAGERPANESGVHSRQEPASAPTRKRESSPPRATPSEGRRAYAPPPLPMQEAPARADTPSGGRRAYLAPSLRDDTPSEGERAYAAPSLHDEVTPHTPSDGQRTHVAARRAYLPSDSEVETSPTLKRATPGDARQAAVAIANAHVDGRPTRPTVPSYGDDELTTPFSPPTVPFHRDLLPPIARASSVPPPEPPQRNSGVVPAGSTASVSRRVSSIPPPPPAMRPTSGFPASTKSSPPPAPAVPTPSYASIAPKRPSLVRVSAPFWDAATSAPRKRASR